MIKKYKYTIEMSSRYRKELRKMLRRGKNEDDILEVIGMLASDTPYLSITRTIRCSESGRV